MSFYRQRQAKRRDTTRAVSTAGDSDVVRHIDPGKRYNDGRERTSMHLIAISVKDAIFDCERRFAVTTSFNAVSNSWDERVPALTQLRVDQR